MMTTELAPEGVALPGPLDGAAYRPRPTNRPQLTVLGVDIGQLHDPSAVCAVRYEERVLSPGDPLFGEGGRFETHYTVLGSQRLPIGTSYPDVGRRICQLAKRLYNRDSRGDYHILVDATGVGRPVVDDVRRQIIPQCQVTAVTLTGGAKGDASILYRRESSVSKTWLVSRLQGILQSGRLHAPRSVEMLAMIEELKVYEIRTKADTGTDQFGAFTVGTHDDLATSLALACAADYLRIHEGPTWDELPDAVL